MAVICAIDVGSNSIRQMIARVDIDSKIQILYDRGEITRLGENVLKRGELNLGRIEKSIKVRAEVIVGGSLILHTILEAAYFKELIVSSRGLRMGMIINMTNENKTKEMSNIEVAGA